MKEALYLNYNSLKKLYYLNQSDQDKFDSIVNSRKNNEETVYVGLNSSFCKETPRKDV